MTLGPVDAHNIDSQATSSPDVSRLRSLTWWTNGTIRIIDVPLVIKDENGNVTSVEMADLTEAADQAS